jgi:hypothetical protein
MKPVVESLKPPRRKDYASAIDICCLATTRTKERDFREDVLKEFG